MAGKSYYGKKTYKKKSLYKRKSNYNGRSKSRGRIINKGIKKSSLNMKIANIATKIAKFQIEKDKPGFETISAIGGLTTGFNYNDVFEDTRQNVFWAPFYNCNDFDVTEALNNVPYNPEIIKVFRQATQMNIQQVNQSNNVEEFIVYKIVPKKKLFDNASMLDIYINWWTAQSFATQMTSKCDRTAAAPLINNFMWKFGFNDIWGDEFNRWFDIRQTYNFGKKFVNRTYMAFNNGVSSATAYGGFTEQHNNIDFKEQLTAKNDVQINLYRPEAEEADATWWNSALNKQQFPPELRYTLYMIVGKANSELKDPTFTGSYANHTTHSFADGQIYTRFEPAMGDRILGVNTPAQIKNVLGASTFDKVQNMMSLFAGGMRPSATQLASLANVGASLGIVGGMRTFQYLLNVFTRYK